VDPAGRARFASYVNNAPADPGLLGALEDAFARVLPLLEQTVTPPGARRPVSLRGRRPQVIVKAANYELQPGQAYEGSWHVEGMQHERVVAAAVVYYAASPNMRGGGLAFRRLRNRNVVPMASIPVQDLGGSDCAGDGGGKDSVATRDETWKSESGAATLESQGGTPAGGGTGDGAGSEQESEEEEEEDARHIPTGFVRPKFSLSGEDTRAASLWSVGYKSQSTPNYVGLGVVETPPGRTLVFKNSLQHQVQPLWNSSTTEPAVRKMLVFWLVDPDRRILSTADVPRQQWDHVRAEVAHVLCRQWCPVGPSFKINVCCVQKILGFAKYGFTQSEACQHRLNLMEERKYSRVAVGDKFTQRIEREYSFCEH